MALIMHRDFQPPELIQKFEKIKTLFPKEYFQKKFVQKNFGFQITVFIKKKTIQKFFYTKAFRQKFFKQKILQEKLILSFQFLFVYFFHQAQRMNYTHYYGAPFVYPNLCSVFFAYLIK